MTQTNNSCQKLIKKIFRHLIYTLRRIIAALKKLLNNKINFRLAGYLIIYVIITAVLEVTPARV